MVPGKHPEEMLLSSARRPVAELSHEFMFLLQCALKSKQSKVALKSKATLLARREQLKG